MDKAQLEQLDRDEVLARVLDKINETAIYYTKFAGIADKKALIALYKDLTENENEVHT